MTLRKKTIIIISTIFLGLLIIVYFTSQNILLTNYLGIEENNVRLNVARVTSALSTELSNMDAMAYDWAAWDDTYNFIEDGNEEYIESNLVDETFPGLDINLMLFNDTAGKMVFGKAVDLATEEKVPLPPGLQAHLANNDLLLFHPDTESSISGLIIIPEGPLLIVSQPILTSLDEGPIRGTLIMGRFLDTSEIEQLAETTHLSLIIRDYDDPQLTTDFQVAKASLSGKAPVFIQPLSEQSIAGYVLLQDLYGAASLMLRIDTSRDIYAQSKTSLNYLMALLMLAVLILCVATVLLLERQFLSKLSFLKTSVSNISTSGDLSKRMSMPGKDELSDLSDSINRMLSVMEKSHDFLQESEERMQLTFDSMTDGVTVTDLNGYIVQVNEAAVVMYGHNKKEEVIGRSSFDFITEKDRDRSREYIQKALIDGYIKDVALMTLTRDGREITSELSAAVLKDASGNPIGLVSITKDITERKQSEEKLQKLYEQEIKLRRELESEIAKRVEFTRALVHELKTPLTAVMASSELLATERHEEPWMSLAQNIYRSASNLNERIGELLDLARGEVGMLHLELRPMDPLLMIEGIVNDMSPVISMNKQSLIAELPPSLPAITADEDRLRQVLLNLLDNATKFTPEGGKIILWAKEKDDFLIMGVRDTGRGITEEEQKRLFQAYHRLESDRERLSGLGLGLVLSKTIVELHGGHMGVQSETGKGSTFSFSIPLGTGEPPEGTEAGEMT